MIRCIVVDDEPLSRELLKDHISRQPEFHLVKLCSNALEAFDIIHKEVIDLIFLDIQMPSMSGVKFITCLKNPPAFIFVTAFSEHAVLSYELNAVDYLLKPVTYERFCIGISKFLKQHIEQETPPLYTYFRVNGKLIKLMHQDILFAESMKNYMIIRTAEAKHITHMTMKHLEELLPDKEFKRIHRSFIINISHVTSIGRNEIEIGKTKLPIGESYKSSLPLWKKK
ncbi:MAG TPA: response regulator [Pedobacter sp.]|jgi:two-component system LytT family response regulator